MSAQKSKESALTKPRTLKTLLAWSAPSRPFKKRGKEFFSTIGTIALLLVIILVFFQEWLLIMVIIAMAFSAYVLATIQPEKVDHQITNRGVMTGAKKYRWGELNRFWFGKKANQTMLYLETRLRFPRLLILLLGETKQVEIKKILVKYLAFEQPDPTWLDKSGDWLSRKFPLE